MAKLFVLAIPAFGSAFIGKTSKDSFEMWRKRLEALKLLQPKRLIMAQGNTQAADPNTKSTIIHITPAYFGDTDQEVIYVDNACVEPIGEIEVQNGKEVCNTARKLFEMYNTAVQEYANRHCSIVSPNLLDIHKISKSMSSKDS